MSDPNHRPLSILFLCTGNSCRSQMAEGFARERAKQIPGASIRVESAGIEAHGKNPLAIEVMREAGIDISDQESTQLTSELLADSDWVVTVCGHAKDHCPVVPKSKKTDHWPLTDPAKASGSPEQVLAEFRSVRDDIQKRVEQLFEKIR